MYTLVGAWLAPLPTFHHQPLQQRTQELKTDIKILLRESLATTSLYYLSYTSNHWNELLEHVTYQNVGTNFYYSYSTRTP